MDGRKGWDFMILGKDIDKNITRQLWERLKNTFTRNDVIPVENGGTGVNDLDLMYPKLISDELTILAYVNRFKLEPGFTLQSDSNALFNINKNSMYIEGRIHVIRDNNIQSSKFIKIPIPNINGYSINKIKIAAYGTRLSINNNILSLDVNFTEKNEYNYIFNHFIPFV